MENYSIIIFILAIMVVLSAVSDKIRLPYPVLMVAVGIAMGFLPGMPEIEISPEVVMLIFLPPLLYDAAFNISFKTFRTNLNTIGTLAIGLVFLTTCAIAVIARYVIPGFTWPLAFVLGSILAATDAVAAISITKGLGLSHTTATILEGESLVNDASALVAYRFAVAAVTGVAFVLWQALIQFLILMGGGFLVGMLMGKLLSFFLVRLKDNTMAVFSFLLLLPFVTYLIAEHLHVSGVIAVVVLGLGISRFTKKVFPEALQVQSKSVWDILIYLLNGLIFILIGLEFPMVIRRIDAHEVWPFVGYAFLITVTALVLRIVRVEWQRGNLWRAFRARKGRISRDALLTLQESIVIGWSGMRGIVSLAIALGLPANFPQRDAIIFIATVVVLFTIIGQGLTLPLVVRKLKPGNA
ncbi:sodium:proton exchanger [Chitinophaga parva]|uniref:Sodium:proton exchanger n=1 Tax=Chitinophaga parva TaxID=2169414 RepID=A0A2T7BBF2_9BACT|nr:cation:proton antiporter [Chitinophaga parva]PUZ21716.1 sodium:proton exchanger [Chitinophaga parva]